MTAVDLIAVLGSVTLAVVGQVLLKQGMTLVGPIDGARLKRPADLVRDIASRWQVSVGLSAYVLSACTWIFALSRVPLSLAYPFLGLSYAAVALVAVLFLGERLTLAQWVGLALVVVGVVVVAQSG